MDELQAFLNGFMSNKSNRRVVSRVEQSPYNPEFVAKIMESEKQYQNGEYTVRTIEDLWNTKDSSEEYTDAEILVYNSMINASKIIAKHI